MLQPSLWPRHSPPSQAKKLENTRETLACWESYALMISRLYLISRAIYHVSVQSQSLITGTNWLSASPRLDDAKMQHSQAGHIDIEPTINTEFISIVSLDIYDIYRSTISLASPRRAWAHDISGPRHTSSKTRGDIRHENKYQLKLHGTSSKSIKNAVYFVEAMPFTIDIMRALTITSTRTPFLTMIDILSRLLWYAQKYRRLL